MARHSRMPPRPSRKPRSRPRKPPGRSAASIAVSNQAHLQLPAGYNWVPLPAARQVMESLGNRVDDSFVGLVFPARGGGWLASVRFIKEGYIKDDDAKEWNAEDLLKSLKEGTEAGNEDRAKRGITPMEVIGWAQAPSYDAADHRLVWSALTRDKGDSGGDQGVNYNTYALGRDGYLSLNLVTAASELEKYKPDALKLLGATQYDDGKKYADFNGSTDKVAAYGLAALVAGAAAKKLGLLAIAFGFIAKFARCSSWPAAPRSGASARCSGRTLAEANVIKLLFLLLSAGKLGKVLLTGGSMLVSVIAYAFVFGWRYAVGFVGLIFVHELGHYLAARQRGLQVGSLMFIPFVGAWTELKDVPHDAETEAWIGFAGPLVGSLAALGCYFAARESGSNLLLALAYAGFFLNLFNLIPLSPFDGGRILARCSPRASGWSACRCWSRCSSGGPVLC